MMQLQGHSIIYRFAVGPQQARIVFTLQTLPPDDDSSSDSDRVAKKSGLSLHAGVSAEGHQRGLYRPALRFSPTAGRDG